MDSSSLTLLYAYNCWANVQILAAFQEFAAVSPQPLASNRIGALMATVCHIANTETAWRALCTTGRYPDELIEPEVVDAAALIAHWQAEMMLMEQYLATLTTPDLQRVLHISSGADRRERILWQGFFHIINHGTQHRSEAAICLTDMGHSPGNLDFTRFLTTKASVGKG